MFGFLGIGNGMIHSFQDLLDKATNIESLNKTMNAFAYGIDIIFLIGILLVIAGLLFAGLEFYVVKTFNDDEDRHSNAKSKLKKALVASAVFISIPLLITIIGFAIAGSGILVS